MDGVAVLINLHGKCSIKECTQDATHVPVVQVALQNVAIEEAYLNVIIDLRFCHKHVHEWQPDTDGRKRIYATAMSMAAEYRMPPADMLRTEITCLTLDDPKYAQHIFNAASLEYHTKQ